MSSCIAFFPGKIFLLIRSEAIFCLSQNTGVAEIKLSQHISNVRYVSSFFIIVVLAHPQSLSQGEGGKGSKCVFFFSSNMSLFISSLLPLGLGLSLQARVSLFPLRFGSKVRMTLSLTPVPAWCHNFRSLMLLLCRQALNLKAPHNNQGSVFLIECLPYKQYSRCLRL